MSHLEQVFVVVPAHDEQERIGGLIASVQASVIALGRTAPGLTVRVLIAADGCTDATAERAYAAGVEVLELERCGVGAARSAGIARLLASVSAPAERVWIANTDADTVVPSEWLAAHIEHARHWDALLGTVRPDAADLSPGAYARWRDVRAREESIGSIHGANLGVRASAYVAVGGFGAEPVHEDVLLVARLRASGARVGATDRGEVVTSGRRDNRVEGGYGGYLHARFSAETTSSSV